MTGLYDGLPLTIRSPIDSRTGCSAKAICHRIVSVLEAGRHFHRIPQNLAASLIVPPGFQKALLRVDVARPSYRHPTNVRLADLKYLISEPSIIPQGREWPGSSRLEARSSRYLHSSARSERVLGTLSQVCIAHPVLGRVPDISASQDQSSTIGLGAGILTLPRVLRFQVAVE